MWFVYAETVISIRQLRGEDATDQKGGVEWISLLEQNERESEVPTLVAWRRAGHKARVASGDGCKGKRGFSLY